ncbi:MAG: hypothetical protein ISEC1_P0568 [Thiomicrorhabdus sp.]|nr:MAG: hypothetical protein ISEC1_P0568 [Thiomicrorhabdus sp.]
MKQVSYLLVAMIISAIIFIWTGAFNMSAKDKHWDITTAALTLIRERSITVRANDIIVPTTLSNPDMITKGAKNYDAMCSQCHLAPDMQPTELHLGLYPQPPILFNKEPDEHQHHEHKLVDTFWIIKNGLKMTGMPAWGDFHSDEQIWELVAFVSQMGSMHSTEYKALVGEGGHSHQIDAQHSIDSEMSEQPSVESSAHGNHSH